MRNRTAFLHRLLCRRLLLAAGAALALTGPPTAGAQPEERGYRLAFWEELAFWETVRDSGNPAELHAYLAAYPDGRFRALASLRIAELDARRATPDADRAGVNSAATAAETPAGALYAARTELNVRAAPSTDAARLTGLAPGQTVGVTGEVAGGSWYRVELDDGRLGYVFAELLEPRLADPGPAPPADAPAELAPGQTFRDCAACPLMVVIAPGRFTLGSDARADEQPVREVVIATGFALAAFELTLEQWQACVGAGGCRALRPERSAGAGETRLPAAGLSWDDAGDYVAWLRGQTGHNYRLPSEAEWEYAARGGSASAYWWGDQVPPNVANCADCGGRWAGVAPAPAGAFAANPYGLYDVHGNLREWTADCWNPDHADAPADGRSRDSGDCGARVVRGGAWKLGADAMRAARRVPYERDARYFLHGVRVARDL